MHCLSVPLYVHQNRLNLRIPAGVPKQNVTARRTSRPVLTLSSPVMLCDIILLILSFICYKFFGLERVNPYHPKKCYNFFGLGRINPFQPSDAV
jgi:hypothetical protein